MFSNLCFLMYMRVYLAVWLTLTARLMLEPAFPYMHTSYASYPAALSNF